MLKLTVIIPTHNPRGDILDRTLAALQEQTLSTDDWELVLIDNASTKPLARELVEWHPRGRVVREDRIGLTHARFRGLSEAAADLLVWSDDDNLLAPDYLESAATAFDQQSGLGAAGGKSIAEYESPPEDWYEPDLAPIGCRDLGDKEIKAVWTESAPRQYPAAAPIGAGLVIRREAMLQWMKAAQADPVRAQLGRTGNALTSGEDNDINLTLLAAGWELAYLPKLRLTHIIPPGRLSLDYQRRIARATFRDFVRVLIIHGVSPWPPIAGWAVPIRKIKAWFSARAWSGPAASIRWHGHCGQIEGRVQIQRRQNHSKP